MRLWILACLVLFAISASALTPSRDWFDENGNQIGGPGPFSYGPDFGTDFIGLIILLFAIPSLILFLFFKVVEKTFLSKFLWYPKRIIGVFITWIIALIFLIVVGLPHSNSINPLVSLFLVYAIGSLLIKKTSEVSTKQKNNRKKS